MHLFHHRGHRDHASDDATAPRTTSESNDRDVDRRVPGERPHQH
jgi:hypothetical protein